MSENLGNVPLGFNEINQTPLNNTARLVVFAKGDHYDAEIKSKSQRHQDYPHRIRPMNQVPKWIKHDQNFKDYTGFKFGDFTVVGLLYQNTFDTWVLRCACGQYEIRRTFRINQPITRIDQGKCLSCMDLERLKHKEYRSKHGIYPWETKSCRNKQNWAENKKEDNMTVIHKTQNYDMFKYIIGNREVTDCEMLKEEIKKNNKLPFKPIIVDKDFGIIDGQHRLQCARELNLPIHYVIDESAKPTDIIMLNARKNTFKVKNFLDFHRKNGVRNYGILYELSRKYGLEQSVLLQIFAVRGRKYSTEVREGVIRFIFTVEEMESMLQKYCFIYQTIHKELGVKGLSQKQRGAILHFTKRDIDAELFIKRCRTNPTSLFKAFQYQDLSVVGEKLLEIYNKWGAKSSAPHENL